MAEEVQPGWHEVPTWGGDDDLRGYVALVAHALGIGWESCSIDTHPPMAAYVALDVTLPALPRRDVALLWDGRHGWSLCVEPRSGGAPQVVAYLGCDVLASPTLVQTFVEAMVAGLPVGQREPPAPVEHGESVTRRLRDYGVTQPTRPRRGVR